MTSWCIVEPRTIESSTITSRLPATSASGLNFILIPWRRSDVVGLDERAADVAVLDQPLAVRDSGRPREADRGGRARVGNRHHEVGLDGRLGCEPLAHPDTNAVHLRACERRVRPREVDVLEDAERLPALRQRLRRAAGRPRRSRRPRRAGPRARTTAPIRSSAHVSEARTQSSPPSAFDQPADRERPDPVRVAEADQLPLGERHDRVGALEPAPSPARRRAGAATDRRRSARRSPRCPRSRRARSRRRRARRAAPSVFVRLPLWPSATVRARPCWTSGCALAQAFAPVVE